MRGFMSVQIGRATPEDRHLPRSPAGGMRDRFHALTGSYAENLYDYAYELLQDPAAAGQTVERVLAAAASHFEHADLDQVQADQASGLSGWRTRRRAGQGVRPWLYEAV